jgi:arylsulfatase A-like enzyme
MEDFVSLTDLAPTFLEAAGVPVPPDMTGRSLLPLLSSGKSGWIDKGRDCAFFGRERHDSYRLENDQPVGYPMRAMRTDQFLYIRNFKPDRWPNGAPYNVEDLALAADYTRHEEAPYRDMDASLTKSWLLAHRAEPEAGRLLELTVGKRPAEELYALAADPDSLRNLAADPFRTEIRRKLAAQLDAVLRKTADPRLTDAFDRPPWVAKK